MLMCNHSRLSGLSLCFLSVFEKTPVCVISKVDIFSQVFNPWYQEAKKFNASYLNLNA